jgi:hypothetical protein
MYRYWMSNFVQLEDVTSIYAKQLIRCTFMRGAKGTRTILDDHSLKVGRKPFGSVEDVLNRRFISEE